jgi:hypothetical protein
LPILTVACDSAVFAQSTIPENLAHVRGTAILAEGLGAPGFGLGVWNLVRSVKADRVHLSVRPAVRWRVPGGIMTITSGQLDPRGIDLNGLPYLCVEVVNLSKFAVTVDEVGLCENSPRRGPRRSFVFPERPVGDALPAVLQPREKATIAAPLEVWTTTRCTSKTQVFACTICDHDATGRNPFLAHCYRVIETHTQAARRRR